MHSAPILSRNDVSAVVVNSSVAMHRCLAYIRLIDFWLEHYPVLFFIKSHSLRISMVILNQSLSKLSDLKNKFDILLKYFNLI